jgi:hypothetical protein
MNINSGEARLVLLCPVWKKWGKATIVKAGTHILHSRADDVVPFADTAALVRNSGLPASALIEVESDHRLADSEPLEQVLAACASHISSRAPRICGCGAAASFNREPEACARERAGAAIGAHAFPARRG